MNDLANIIIPTFSLYVVGIIAVVCFIAGFFIRAGVTAKRQERIIELEDEMLSNHARILELEKKLSEVKQKENTEKEKQVTPNTNVKVFYPYNSK